MIKNLSSTHLVLISIAAVVLLLAAFSFLLLQDPTAPLPFAWLPATSSSTPQLAPQVLIHPTATVVPTRQTSYTPFASLLTPSSTGRATGNPMTETATNNPSQSLLTQSVTPSKSPARTSTNIPTRTQPASTVSPSPSISPTPTITDTLSAGEYAVTGRVVQNGTPVANVTVEFEDDIAPRNSGTNQTGHYWFTTLAPGTNFSLTFKQSDNSLLTPTAEITSLAWINGVLPTNIKVINLPDLEISINLNDTAFELQAPMDGAYYSASVISQSHQIQFVWSSYYQGGSYHVELGPRNSQDPVWTSDETTYTNIMWNGTLDSGGHVAAGAYWWRVAVTRPVENYTENIFTQTWDILFNP